jgi:hypothetical protein
MPAPKQTKVKFSRAKADKIIKKVEKHIKPFVDRQLACGSYRRGAQMIGDIDFVIIPKKGVTLPQMLPPNDGINWVGDNKAQVIIDGEKVDFKVTTPDAWGATILYFTGPADFNIKYRWMAKKRGMKLNEYGLWDRTTDAYIAGATEQDIYDALKRPFRDPDQRKGWKAESNYIDYDNWNEDRETMHEEKWKLYKQQGGKTPITNKTSKRDHKLLNDIMEKLGIDYEPKKYVIDNPTMAYRAMPFTDYAKALEIGYLYPPKQGIFASLNPTPTKAQASWKGYPVFEIDITGLTVTFKSKQGDEQGRIITIDEPISVDRILHYGKNSYEGWKAETTKFNFITGKEYTFDELPDDNAGRSSLKEDAIHHFRSKEDGGYGFSGSHLDATYRAVIIPNKELVQRFGHLRGKSELQKNIEEYGLDYPSIGNEGNNRRIAMAKLGRDMPHLEIIAAETFGSENQWIVNNLTMLLTQRARTLKELIDDLGIRGITVESNLVRNSTFVRVGKHVPAVWGLNDQDYSVRHPYNAISPSAGRKQHLKTMFEKLDPREKEWDVTWNQKSDEPDWADEVEWDAENYEVISLQEMDDFLQKRRFKPVDMYYRRRPVKEWVYERKLPNHANHFIRVYTTIQRYGGKTDQSRDVGKDAIRVQVIYRDDKGETLVSMPKRVNRVSTWRKNLDDRMTEIAQTLPTVTMDSRGEPMTLRKKKGSLFWGSRDYPNYKETRRYGAEQEDLSAGIMRGDQYNHIDDPESLKYIYDNFVSPFLELSLTILKDGSRKGVMFGPDYREQIDNMMATYKYGFLMRGRHDDDVWLVIPIYSRNNEVHDIQALSVENGILVLQDSLPLSDIFDAVSGTDPFYFYDELKSSIWKALDPDRFYKDAINYSIVGKGFAEGPVVAPFRSEEIINLGAEEGMTDDYLINIMITEYLVKNAKDYDVLEISKRAMNNINIPTYDFIRGMARQFAGDFDLVPNGPDLMPYDFISYAKNTKLADWGNLNSRGIATDRFNYLLRLITSNKYWKVIKPRSAINYQNI